MQQRPALGATALIGAALCWGFGFYAQRVSIESLSPLWATAGRFIFASPIAAIALVVCARRGVRIPWREGAVIGVCLYIAFALQTVAMLYTPVSRVALITGLYAVTTPLMQPWFGMGRPSRLQLVAAGVAVLGTALLCGVFVDDEARQTPPNLGDLLTLGMAVLGGVITLLIGRYAHKVDVVALNASQMVVMLLASVATALVVDGPVSLSIDERTAISLIYLAVFSTAAAFLLQMIGQRHISPSPAAIIMMLEIPIGVTSALVLLHERMSVSQWTGAVVLFAAVVMAIVSERPTSSPP